MFAHVVGGAFLAAFISASGWVVGRLWESSSPARLARRRNLAMIALLADPYVRVKASK